MADVRVPRNVGCDEAGVLIKRGLAMIAFRLLRYSIVDGGEVCRQIRLASIAIVTTLP